MKEPGLTQWWSVSGPGEPDRELVAAALRGDAVAAMALTRAIADQVWTACHHVTPSRAETKAAFREVMGLVRADRFARLAGADGRAPLTVHVALVVRDLLAARVVQPIALDAAKDWRAFEGFFATDIRRSIARLLPGDGHRQSREDAYQAVCEALLRNHLNRLRASSGRGSTAGSVMQVVENLVIDHVRTILPRRRLPAAIARLSALDRAVFRLIAWERLPPDPPQLVARLARDGQTHRIAEVASALQRVRSAAYGHLTERQSESWLFELSAAEGTRLAAGAEGLAASPPEGQVVGDEASALLDQALMVLEAVLPRLDADAQIYVQLALAGHPARDIARTLGVPAETAHRQAQQVKRQLRRAIGGETAGSAGSPVVLSADEIIGLLEAVCERPLAAEADAAELRAFCREAVHVLAADRDDNGVGVTGAVVARVTALMATVISGRGTDADRAELSAALAGSSALRLEAVSSASYLEAIAQAPHTAPADLVEDLLAEDDAMGRAEATPVRARLRRWLAPNLRTVAACAVVLTAAGTT